LDQRDPPPFLAHLPEILFCRLGSLIPVGARGDSSVPENCARADPVPFETTIEKVNRGGAGGLLAGPGQDLASSTDIRRDSSTDIKAKVIETSTAQTDIRRRSSTDINGVPATVVAAESQGSSTDIRRLPSSPDIEPADRHPPAIS
jgi:hypothetical protein